jgi:hypothetical protein
MSRNSRDSTGISVPTEGMDHFFLDINVLELIVRTFLILYHKFRNKVKILDFDFAKSYD